MMISDDKGLQEKATIVVMLILIGITTLYCKNDIEINQII